MSEQQANYDPNTGEIDLLCHDCQTTMGYGGYDDDVDPDDLSVDNGLLDE